MFVLSRIQCTVNSEKELQDLIICVIFVYTCVFVAWRCVVFVLSASRNNSAKICVKPAPHSDQRRSRFYRRSNSASSSSSASVAAERFHCDVSVMCDTAADDGHFMFNFTADDDRTDRQETDRVSNSDTTDSDTVRGRNTLTSSVTGTNCDNNVTSRSDNFTTLNSAQGTPFLFNFDSS